MKRLFSFMAVLICAALLSTSAFAAADDAYGIYSKSIAKLKKVKSYEITTTSQSKTVMFGSDVGSTEKINTKYLYTDAGKLQFSSTLSKDGAKLGTFYYKDGYIYSNIDKSKIKTKMPATLALGMVSGIIAEYDEESFSGATVSQLKSGGKRIKIKIDDPGDDPDLVNALLNVGNTSYKYSDILYTMDFDENNNLKNMKVSYNTQVESGDMTMKISQTITTKIVSTNKLKSIEFPSNLSSYKTA